MVAKRPRVTRRALRVKRRRIGARVMRPIGGLKTGIMSLKRTFRWENWVPGTATTSDFWKYYQPSLGNLPSVAEFQALFDQYRINGIKVVLIPRYSGFDGSNTTDTTLPGVTNQGQCHVHAVIEKSTVNPNPSGTYTSANLNTFMENGNVRSYQANRPLSFYIRKPCVLGTVQGLSARAIPSPWLGTDQTSVAHRGIHLFITDVNMTGVFGQAFDVYFTYYMQFKGTK